MINDKKFIEYCDKASDSEKETMFNFCIYTFCKLSIKSRFWIALEILLGKKFCVWISRNQER